MGDVIAAFTSGLKKWNCSRVDAKKVQEISEKFIQGKSFEHHNNSRPDWDWKIL